uniref:Uncharacterized protein n=1 Tax=Glossina palpalis gambiensis TaxID=67801 RepID=A0A1B0AZB2_9MUSC
EASVALCLFVNSDYEDLTLVWLWSPVFETTIKNQLKITPNIFMVVWLLDAQKNHINFGKNICGSDRVRIKNMLEQINAKPVNTENKKQVKGDKAVPECYFTDKRGPLETTWGQYCKRPTNYAKFFTNSC